MTRFRINPDMAATAADLCRHASAAHWHYQLGRDATVWRNMCISDMRNLAVMLGYDLVKREAGE